MWRQIVQVMLSTQRERQRAGSQTLMSQRVRHAFEEHRASTRELEDTIEELLAENRRLRDRET